MKGQERRCTLDETRCVGASSRIGTDLRFRTIFSDCLRDAWSSKIRLNSGRCSVETDALAPGVNCIDSGEGAQANSAKLLLQDPNKSGGAGLRICGVIGGKCYPIIPRRTAGSNLGAGTAVRPRNFLTVLANFNNLGCFNRTAASDSDSLTHRKGYLMARKKKRSPSLKKTCDFCVQRKRSCDGFARRRCR